jgi:translation initiation factor IF-3
LINDKIRVRNLLIINEAGEKLGPMTNQEALLKARELGLDLVLISPNAPVPVAKIMNFGKFQYELKKRDKKSKQNHVEVKVKEIYVKPNIGDHDIN